MLKPPPNTFEPEQYRVIQWLLDATHEQRRTIEMLQGGRKVEGRQSNTLAAQVAAVAEHTMIATGVAQSALDEAVIKTRTITSPEMPAEDPDAGVLFTQGDEWIDEGNNNAIHVWTIANDPDTGEETRGWVLKDIGGALETRGIAEGAVTDNVTEYAVGPSDTVPPSSGWSTATPTRSPGSYVWMRAVITYGDGSTSTTNPVLVTGNDGTPGNDGAPGAPGKGIVSTTIAYAVSASGSTAPSSGWQANPPSAAPGQFMWTRTIWQYSDSTSETGYSVGRIGANGADGDDGLPGKDGVSITDTEIRYAASSSGTSAPSSGWQANPPSAAPGQFMWTRMRWTYSDSTSETGYSVAKIGETGNDGRGIDSTVVNYAASASGSNPPASGWQPSVPAVPQGQFLWTRTVVSYTSGSPSTSYSVSRQGQDGANGTPGNPGADGKTSYLHVAYANSANGTVNFSTTDPSGRAYMGTYTDFSVADSTNPSSYTWSLIKGADGSNGTPGPAGNGISSSVVSYAAHASGSSAPSSGWQSTIPTVPQGQFLWTRTVITFTDSAQTTTYAVARMGADGTDGADGADGISVTSIVRYYRQGTSAPAKPTVANPPDWTTTEPGYSASQSLYYADRVTFSNSAFSWSDVQLSSSYALAVEAMTTALGKNSIFRSAAAPLASPGVNGDTWEQWSSLAPGGTLLAFWRHNGSTWVKGTLDEAYIPAINIGTGTYGKLEGRELIGCTVRTAETGARSEMTTAGYRVIDASGQDLVRIGHGAPTGMEVYNPGMSALVPLANAAFGVEAISRNNSISFNAPANEQPVSSGGPGHLNAWTRHNTLTDDLVLTFTAVAPRYVIHFSQTWAVSYNGEMGRSLEVKVAPSLTNSTSGLVSSGNGGSITGKTTLPTFRSDSNDRVGTAIGMAPIETTVGNEYTIYLYFQTRGYGSSSIVSSIAARSIMAMPVFN